MFFLEKKKKNILMIEVTRLNGQKFLINPDHIRSVEQKPDTIIGFEDGQFLMVKETPREIVQKIVGFRNEFLSNLDKRESEL